MKIIEQCINAPDIVNILNSISSNNNQVSITSDKEELSLLVNNKGSNNSSVNTLFSPETLSSNEKQKHEKILNNIQLSNLEGIQGYNYNENFTNPKFTGSELQDPNDFKIEPIQVRALLRLPNNHGVVPIPPNQGAAQVAVLQQQNQLAFEQNRQHAQERSKVEEEFVKYNIFDPSLGNTMRNGNPLWWQRNLATHFSQYGHLYTQDEHKVALIRKCMKRGTARQWFDVWLRDLPQHSLSSARCLRDQRKKWAVIGGAKVFYKDLQNVRQRKYQKLRDFADFWNKQYQDLKWLIRMETQFSQEVNRLGYQQHRITVTAEAAIAAFITSLNDNKIQQKINKKLHDGTITTVEAMMVYIQRYEREQESQQVIGIQSVDELRKFLNKRNVTNQNKQRRNYNKNYNKNKNKKSNNFKKKKSYKRRKFNILKCLNCTEIRIFKFCGFEHWRIKLN